MMSIRDDLLEDVLVRTGYLGVVGTIAGWWWFGWAVAAGIAVGAALAVANTAALAVVLDRLVPESDSNDAPDLDGSDLDDSELDDSESVDSAGDDGPDAKSSALWATGLFFKMTLLFGLAYLAMAWLGVHPLGLVVGYSLLLPGLVWAWWRHLRRQDDAPRGLLADRSNGSDGQRDENDADDASTER